MCTFAIPNDGEAIRSARAGFFNAFFESSLKRLKGKVQAIVPNQENSRASISLLGIRVSDQAKNNKKYTKKSLILAQDER